MNYYRHFMGDYLRDTMHLTCAQDGLYRRMLDLYYSTEKPLTLDLEKLYSSVRANTSKDRRNVDKILLEFFKKTKGGYRNTRADEEISRDLPRILAASSNGKKGGRPKTQTKPAGFQESVVTGNPDESSPAPAPAPAPAKVKTIKPIQPRFACPGWISEGVWTDFEEMRKKERHPLTDGARCGIVRDLEKLRARGNDPNEVLQQSINRGWRGVFELREGNNNGRMVESFQERQQRESRETIDRVAEKYSH